MGFLRQDTNNVILDAVLTDIGRSKLAKGNFTITKFALSDDEVNYGIITQYGQTVGKEKIEKNTPVFEALTNSNFALRSSLISISNPNQVYMPVLSVSPTGVISLSESSTTTISLQQTVQNGESSIPAELVDNLYYVFLNRLFLEIPNKSPVNNDTLSSNPTFNTARYELVTPTPNLTFTIKAKSIPATTFSTYSSFSSSVSSGQYIRTFIKIVGRNSGLEKEIEVHIS